MFYYDVALLASPLEPLTYCFEKHLEAGRVVEVQLRNKASGGVVLGTCQEPSFKTLAIVFASDRFFSLKQIEAARFIANYYVCSLGEALGLMVPFLNRSLQAEACVTESCNTDFSPYEKPLACEAKASPPIGRAQNGDAASAAYESSSGFTSEAEAPPPIGRAQNGDAASAAYESSSGFTSEAEASPPIGRAQNGDAASAAYESSSGFTNEAKASPPIGRAQNGDAASAAYESSSGFTSEAKASPPIGRAQNGDAASAAYESSSGFTNEAKASPPITFTLSPKQTEALRFLQSHKVSLLFGDTGSGKTEIYMKYFEELLACNKRSIFLMPEISLTPQMEQRLKIHFGEQVLLWHSKLTKKQKENALECLYDGSAKIIAGPRSALFLPVEDLGLIVVDEEHDDSYKSSSRPRYNARDLAIYMGKLYDVPVVLGSATPSLGSYVKFPYFRLKGGHYSSQKEFMYEHGVESISPSILHRLEQGLKAREQAIVFIPTRANFKHLLCADCGYHFTCSFCSVGMSVHQKMHALKCHYCGFTQAIAQVCPECGSHNLTSSRLGTAEAVRNLRESFPDGAIEQFDRDVITTQNKLKKTLKRFNDKEIDILVGTQMLSKGHDYHDVTLAVVLGMDNMLGMSDYRAREKALATVLQVAGRSGRKKDARVIVQTFHEDFFRTYIGRYEAFLEDEKEFRKELYPPYKKLCRLLFAHANGHKARDAMEETAVKLRMAQGVEIVGHGKCAIEKVANKYRFEILLRSDKSTDLLRAVRMCASALAEVDMDPIEFG